jgi:hypothetical protein
VNTWTKGDDAAVCLSYRDHGVKATPALLAALAHLTPGSIGMRSWISEAGLEGSAAWVPVGWEERDPQRFWLSVLGALRQTTAGSGLVAGADGGARPHQPPAIGGHHHTAASCAIVHLESAFDSGTDRTLDKPNPPRSKALFHLHRWPGLIPDESPASRSCLRRVRSEAVGLVATDLRTPPRPMRPPRIDNPRSLDLPASASWKRILYQPSATVQGAAEIRERVGRHGMREDTLPPHGR